MGKRLRFGAREIGWLFATALVLGLAWRSVRYGMGFPLWGDEAFIAVSFQVRGFTGLFGAIDYGQIAPVGFLEATLASVRLLGISEYSLRLVSFLAGVGSLGLFALFSRRVLGRRPALYATAIFAASYYLVRHGAEVKPYAGDLFVALALLVLGWNVHRRPRAASWTLLIACGVAAAWASYTSIFIAGGVGLVLAGPSLRSKSRGTITAFLLYALLVPASFVVMMATVGDAQAKSAPWLWEIETWKPFFPPLTEPARWLPWLWQTHAGNMLAYPVGGPSGASALTLALVIAGSVWLWRRKGRTLLALLLGPLALLFVAAAMKRYPYGGSARVTLFLAPAFCMLAGVGAYAALRRLPEGARAWTTRGLLTLLAAVIFIGIAVDVRAPYKEKRDDLNRRALASLASSLGPDDRLVVFNAMGPSPHAPNLYETGGAGAAFRFYLVHFSPTPVLWSPDPDSVGAPPGGRFRLVAYRYPSKPFPEDQLADYVATLSRRFGDPALATFTLRENETIRAWVYPAQIKGASN